MKKAKKIIGKNKVFFIVFGVLFLIYLLWWLAFFPGTLSPDSISHWYEVESFQFSNASPYLYSLIMWVLALVWKTPAMMGLLQLFILAMMVSLFLNYAQKKGIDKRVVIGVTAYFALHPLFGIYNVTIWKDVLYSYVVLAALLLVAYLQMKQDGKNNLWYFLLGALIGFIPLLRFNGIVFFLFIPIILLLTKAADRKQISSVVLTQFSIYFFFSVFLMNALHVIPAPMMKEGIYVKLVGSIYHLDKPNLAPEERAIFEKIMPENTWKEYYQCISVDNLFYVGLSQNRSVAYNKPIDPVPEFVTDWHKAVIAATLKNPGAIVYDKSCMGAYLLGIKDVLYKYEGSIYLADKNGPIRYESKSPLAKRVLYKYLVQLSAGAADGYGNGGLISKFINFLLWSALIPMTLLLLFGYIAVKKRLVALGSIVLLMLLNVAAVVVLVPAASFRYVYVLFVAAPFLPVIYFLESKKIHKTKPLKQSK